MSYMMNLFKNQHKGISVTIINVDKLNHTLSLILSNLKIKLVLVQDHKCISPIIFNLLIKLCVVEN